jgi:DNA-binding beta-propeller fold protein YncE
MRKPRWTSVRIGTLAWIATLVVANAAAASFVTFESGQVRPLAIAPDGSQLLAVNTPDNRLEVFDVGPTGSLTHAVSVPVGLEPVAVAVRSDGSEAWVVNHLSDSVSIVDLTSNPPRVRRTLFVGDEPRDIVFAGTGANRAFVTAAHRGQNTPFHATIDTILKTPGIGRADVWVFDATNLGAPMGGTPLTIVTLFGDTPRALAVSPDGNSVYAAVFQSGNRTATVSEGVVCNDSNLNNNTVPGPCTIGGVSYPGGMPLPERSSDGVGRPETGLIVKFNAAANQWRDQLNRNWNNAIKFNLPDRDVFVINAAQNPPAQVPGAPGFFSGVGTVLFNMITNPVDGTVYVTNTEAKNEVRFEGPGILGGSTVRGHLAESRITVLAGGTATPQHLNKHINYAVVPSPAGVEDSSLATPVGMAITSDGNTLYVAAFGSAKVGVYDTTALELGTFTPETIPHIPVTGGGPTGLVLDEPRDRLYVFTRFDNAISVIDTVGESEVQHVTVHNPEPASVVVGRPFLYDALGTSSNGEAACASCHIFGDFDSLAWDLGNPDDEVLDQANPFRVTDPLGTSFPDHHPMKGPMTTQSLRGMANHGPMHWRGDRSGANDPGGDALDEDAAFKRFNVAFGGLLGREGPLSAAQMQAFTDFILQVIYPPNPIRNLDDSLTADQQAGRNFYFNSVPSDVFQSCNGCHVLNRAQGFFGSDGFSSFENESQLLKIAHLRNMYQKVGMFGMPQIAFVNAGDNGHKGDQIRGFGFLHDGSIDTVFRFHNAIVFNQCIPGFGCINGGGFANGAAGDPLRRQVESFMFAFDSNLAPVVGQQVTLSSTSGADAGNRINLLIAQASTDYFPGSKSCDLVVKGTLAGEARGWLYLPASAAFTSDRIAEGLIGDADLRDVADVAGQELTYTCVPPGSGVRIGIDRDDDGTRDGDEGGSPSACPPAPAVGCRVAAASSLQMRAEAGREKLAWRWAKGAPVDPSDLGDPVGGTTTYDLCIYDGDGLILSAHVPAQAGWKSIASGVKYSDRTLANDGIQSVLLKSGLAGKTRTSVKGRGVDLPILPFPPGGPTLPVTVQLANDLAECWESTFPTATTSNAEQFKAKF